MKTTLKINIAILLLFTGVTAFAQTYTAAVKTTRQEQTNWCWSASSKCILDYYSKPTSQCTIAEYARSLDGTFGTTPCCSNPTGKCNNANYMEGNSGIQGIIKHFGNINSDHVMSPLSVSKVQSQLGQKMPFVIFIQWSGGGGHFVVGCSYSGTSMTFMDPWQNNGMTTQKYTGVNRVIATNTGNGSWDETLVVTTPFSTTGIDEQATADAVSVYPNPSEGILNINTSYKLKSINVFSATGQLVDSYAALENKSYSFKISMAGLYTVQVITDNGITYKKVVVN